jgi:radical SAM superfamily enzyme YgiQ (UPF0313 family)
VNQTPIVLGGINARYAHTAFGLRYLWSNLGPLRSRAEIREFTIQQPPLEIAESLLEGDPRIVGLGVYIWNVDLATRVVQTLKAVRPDVAVVIGGPEVSYEYEGTPIFEAADYLIRGEGDCAFAELAEALLAGRPPEGKLIDPPPPDTAALRLPYGAYTDEDLDHRVVYVEASRGCPFRCEFCLSSLDDRVRLFPLEPLLASMQRLLDRGARHFKFIDRTFNLRRDRVEAILRFFLDRWREGMQLHFEMVPDRLGPEMLDWLARFPPGGLHLEVGIQTFNPESQAAISRRQDLQRTEQTLEFLRSRTGAILHADLIAGLPGETWETFGEGFSRLVALRPQEIQVGILKRLKGTPIARHTESSGLVFAGHAPYEILKTDRLDFDRMQRIRRFARYFDLYYNSGNFPESLDLLWKAGSSPFDAFMRLSDALWAATGKTHELSLARQAQHLHDFLLETRRYSAETVAEAVRRDFRRLPGRKDRLEFLARPEKV